MKRVSISTLSIGLLLGSGVAFAGGPMVHQGETGAPYSWPQGKSIVWNPDLGNLGDMDNAEAVATIEAAFQVWSSVEGVELDVVKGAPLAVDVTAANVGEHLYRCDGRSPVIFDEDGSIMDSLLGEGGGCALLGFAGPECISSKEPHILEGMVVISGRALDADGPCPVPPSLLKQTLVHELGHFINLGHTQVNGNAVLFNEPVPGFPEQGVPGLKAVAMMYPILFVGDRGAELATDDAYWLSQLYPAESMSGGMLRGEVKAGDQGLQGVNLVLRDPLNPHFGAVSVVSGHKMVGDTPDESLRGVFEFPGLGTGDYILEAGEVNESFTGGSSLPPLSQPLDVIPGRAEFLEFYGGEEDSDPAIDDPELYDLIRIRADEANAPITLDLNQPLYCATDYDCSEGSWCDEDRCVPMGPLDPGSGDGIDVPTPSEGTPTEEETPIEEGTAFPTESPAPEETVTPTPAPETETPTSPGETDPDSATQAPGGESPSESPSPGDGEVPEGCACDDAGSRTLGSSFLMLMMLVGARGGLKL